MAPATTVAPAAVERDAPTLFTRHHRGRGLGTSLRCQTPNEWVDGSNQQVGGSNEWVDGSTHRVARSNDWVEGSTYWVAGSERTGRRVQRTGSRSKRAASRLYPLVGEPKRLGGGVYPLLRPFKRSSLAENRVVRRRPLLVRPAIRVVVERNRLARPPLGTGERLRMAVEREIRGAEDHRPVEDGQHLLLAAGHVPVPQLQMAAVLLLPILVQVDQQVQTAVQLEQRVPVEIHVDFQEAAGLDLVRPGPAVVRIGDQPFDAGERPQELEQRRRIHLIKKELDARPQGILVPVAELLLRGVVELAPGDLVRTREIVQNLLQDLVRKEVVQDDVGERPRVHV